MNMLTCRNVNDGFESALWRMKSIGVMEQSRNGWVQAAQSPVIVEYRNPLERVHLCSRRDANPYFHVMEAMWMLAGHNDVAWPAQFASNIANYSDDGKTLSGAYGYRWRFQFNRDQIDATIRLLRADRETRRAVIAMWDPSHDTPRMVDGKDLPCNTHIYFRPRGNKLDMTVCNRSNDLVWGMFGANVVHMSFLHEMVARCSNFEIGSYYQFTNNLHVYEQHWDLVNNPPQADPYVTDWNLVPLCGHSFTQLYTDLAMFMDDPEAIHNYYNFDWFNDVARPMYMSHIAYREGDRKQAQFYANRILADDWRVACLNWLSRRKWEKSNA